MKWKFGMIIIGMLILLGAGCTSGEEQKSVFNPYKSEITGDTVQDCSFLEPDNPYSFGSGHYAGFKWAEENEPGICDGNSQSFIEGCEDFQSQQEDYENCLNN